MTQLDERVTKAMHDPGPVDAIRPMLLAVPLATPQTTANAAAVDAIYLVVVEVEAHGVTGTGYAIAVSEGQARSVAAIVDDLRPVLLGEPARDIRRLWSAMWRRLAYIGHAGPPLLAMAALDTALWDAHSRSCALPLYQLLGGGTAKLPVYVTGGSLNASGDELAAEALQLRAQGYRAFKVRIGQSNWRLDIDRLSTLSRAVGDSMELMVDVGQAWDVSTAIAASRELEALGVTWFEEPVPSHDLRGMAEIRATTAMRVAAGESAYNRFGVAALIDAQATDVLMADLGHCGGITELLHVASLAETRFLPLSAHGFAEVSAHVLATSRNPSMLEFFPGVLDSVFSGLPEVRDGSLHLSDRPGLGFELRRGAASELAVDSSLSPAGQREDT